MSDRGIYSGTFGVIEPNGNFDFNVIIRSAVYNKEKKQTTIKVGSAITQASNAEAEYEECLLKAASTLSIFN
jgi:para-aminobenzoate synthetase component 1